MTELKDLPLSMRKQALAQYPALGHVEKTVPASKYMNVKAQAHGMRFDSGHEAEGVSALILAEEQHKVFGLRLQVRFPLPGGIVYVPDAVYSILKDGLLMVVVEDFKAWDKKLGQYRYTGEYKIKKKLFESIYGIKIRES